MIDYKALAKTAAVDFVQKNVPLNTTITKLAEENNLNQPQISRVCELSNKAVHQYGLLKSADKNFTFDLADSSKILCNINNNNDSGLTTSFEPEKPKMASLDSLYKSFGIEKTAFDLKRKQDREALINKFAAAISEVQSRIVYGSIKLAEEVQDFKSQIQQMLQYGIKLEDIRQTLVSAQPEHADEINKLIGQIKPGVISGTAAEPAENAKIIPNPKHPVVIRVKNIFSQNDSLQSLENSKKYLTLKKCQLEECKK